MPLTRDQFLAALEESERKIAQREAPEGVELCGGCGVPLQESITGNRHLHGKNVCSDCYFEAWGAEIEQHPIGGPLRARGG